MTELPTTDQSTAASAEPLAAFRTYLDRERPALAAALAAALLPVAPHHQRLSESERIQRADVNIAAYIAYLDTPQVMREHVRRLLDAPLLEGVDVLPLVQLTAVYRAHMLGAGLRAVAAGIPEAAEGTQALMRCADVATEEIVRYHEERLRLFEGLVENANDGIVVTDALGTIRYANPALVRLAGFDSREALMVHAATGGFTDPAGAEHMQREVLPRIMADGAYVWTADFVRPDGSRFLGQNSAFVLRAPTGEMLGLASFVRDVTAEAQVARERERLLEDLRDANDQLESSFVNSPLAIVEWDSDGTVQRWNPAAERIFGWSAEEMVGKNAYAVLVPGVTEEQALAIARQVFAAGAASGPYTNITKDGRIITCQWYVAPRYDASGTHTGMVSQAEDITEELKAAEDLRRNQALFQGVIDNSPSGVSVVALDQTILLVNRAVARNMGMEPEQIIGRKQDDLFPQDSVDSWAPGDRQVIESGAIITTEDVVPLPAGDKIFSTVKFPIRNDSGEIYAVGNIITDITDQRRAAEVIRRSEERFRDVVRSSKAWVWEVDAQGRYVYTSEQAAELLGYSVEDLLGKTPFDLMPPDEAQRVGGIFATTVAGRLSIHELESRNLTKDGREVILVTNGVPIITAAGDLAGYRGICIDVTAQKQAEAERTALQEQVIQAQQAALRELSTPLIPLADGVVAMPLIGSIDSARAQQIIESLLDGVAQNHARVAILDITGVPVVDTQVANALIRAAQAVKLLGAKVVLTGIRPEVAQTLVGLGVDLSGIVTRSSLQAGIAFALGR